MKTLIVDIDNTLWPFAPELFRCLRVANPFLPHYSEWHQWDFWKDYCTKHVFYQTLAEIHLRQDCYPPYSEAPSFLSSLRSAGFFVVIASHREEKTRTPTVAWLRKYGLYHDQVHLSPDKSVLFRDAWGLVDDSPALLDKAAQAGLVRAGLSNPWNARSGHPLFPNLPELLSYLLSEQGPCVPSQ